jgi:drug/metabolite transporter (DMT)-like permease
MGRGGNPLMFQSTSSVLWSSAQASCPAICHTCFYTYGLSGVETGKAAVMASVEPVVATIVGIAAFGEGISIQNASGVLLVLAAIAMLNIQKLKRLKTIGKY